MSERPSVSALQVRWQLAVPPGVGRPLELCRMCGCGCDRRAGLSGVGYLIACDHGGRGITIEIPDEYTFEILAEHVPVVAGTCGRS